MRISLNNVWLTNDGETDLHLWTDARDVQFNGQQVVQDAQFLRALAAEPMARGNAVNVVRFTVTRQYATVAMAAAAVLAEMPVSAFRGTRTDTTFVLRGGAMTTSSTTLSVIDGDAFTVIYDYPLGGTVDGGNAADALVPSGLDVDGGTLV